jgi:hypothetical protein
MHLLRRRALVLTLLALGCGNNPSPPSSQSMPSSEAGAPTPGQEGGPPGSRGGGGGAFGGGQDPDAQVPTDGPQVAVDGADPQDDGPSVRRDAARPRDLATAIDIASTPDLGPGVEAGANVCGDGTCEAFATQYTAALARARVCNAVVKAQCGATASTSLACAGCKVWVNSTVELDAIRAQWTGAGCVKCVKACPAIACRALTTGVCHSKMLAAPPGDGDKIAPPPATLGTCIDQSDPVTF